MLVLKTKVAITVTCSLVVGLGITLPTSEASADPSQYECKALNQDVGREEADMAAPLLRRVDGSLQLAEVGDVYYTTFDTLTDKLDWLELYGAQAQRGNSFIGYFQFQNFSCAK
ncbi:MAG: hypothetical protein AB8B94_05550 [Hyphomicrobiales bacterium]